MPTLPRPSQQFLGGIFERVSPEDKINFARHLSIVIKAGLPILEGLRVIRKQVGPAALGRVIDEVIEDINNGQFLADSLERHGRIFGEFFVNIIRVGETSGTLSANLAYLAEEMRKAAELRRKVRSALIYPCVILVATVGVTSLLTFFIFPKVLPIFTTLKVDLPFTTRALIATLNFFLKDGGWVILGAAAAAVAWFLLMRVERVRFALHTLFLHTPVLAALTVNVNMASFTRVLGILLKSGIKIVEAVTITSKTFDNLVYRRAMLEAAEEVRRGEQFANYLGRRKTLFPPLLSGMVEIGENTGNLEENLEYLSEHYAEEVDASIRDLTTLLEPMLLLLMGFLVGFVALSIITPIYQVTQNIHP